MQPGIGCIVCNDSKKRVVAIIKSKNCDKRINDPENLEKCLRRTGASHPAEEKHDPGGKMYNIVRRVYVKDAK
jgi:hypothetical protein